MIGYANSGASNNLTEELHAWNAVQIADKWLLLDVTWASNYLDENGSLDDRFNAYFKQEGKAFSKKHFPFDPVWQLSAFVKSSAEFFAESSASGTEGVSFQRKLLGDFNKILEEDAKMDANERSLRSYERAIAFLPDEKRLYDVLNYFKSEKAQTSKSTNRQLRLCQEVQRFVSELIMRKVLPPVEIDGVMVTADPLMTIARADVSPDMKTAKIYVRHFDVAKLPDSLEQNLFILRCHRPDSLQRKFSLQVIVEVFIVREELFQ